VVAGCGSARAGSASSVPGVNAALTTSAASCAAQTPAQDRARAQLIFDAIALPGRSAGRSGALLSPARLRVLRYLKGHGPRVVKVQTAITAGSHAGEYSYVEDHLQPHAGQRWLIYGQRTRGGALITSICSGSHQTGPPPPRDLLDGDGIGRVTFGASPGAVITGLKGLLGRPSSPYKRGGACDYDHTIQWGELTVNFQRSRFVGYSYGMYGTLRPPRPPRHGVSLATDRGLRVGDMMIRGQRLYGRAFSISEANGGTWYVHTARGLIAGFAWGNPKHGDIAPHLLVATIEAGAVGCAALSP